MARVSCLCTNVNYLTRAEACLNVDCSPAEEAEGNPYYNVSCAAFLSSGSSSPAATLPSFSTNNGGPLSSNSATNSASDAQSSVAGSSSPPSTSKPKGLAGGALGIRKYIMLAGRIDFSSPNRHCVPSVSQSESSGLYSGLYDPAAMSSYDKVVKLACKPKAAPPKAKYLDPIIAATWSDDGAVHDVCKALSPRFREPNSVVVFKALIVLHTMIRNGATDNVLSYLSSSEVLRLSNVSAGNWEGYTAPQNLQNYAVYLDSRIRAYRDLKHDAIRVQAESNRDMRNSASVEEDGYLRGKKATLSSSSTGPQRSKTIIGRKLRVMTVEKGLLRETKVVHKMIDTLVECRVRLYVQVVEQLIDTAQFYLDDLEDELTTTALRMLVKDLLILFQAGNEGVINVLEHYFEMSHIDAEEALAIYRHFCKQTEKVVEYLGVAKKLQNILNVPIPNLKHAPVSLAGALEEYLSDPNFEQNRIEYRTNKEASQKGRTNGAATSKSNKAPSPSPVPPPPTNAAQNSFPSSQPQNQSEPNKAVLDFFAGIEQEQPNMFNPQTNSPNSAYFQQQGAANPFVQMGMASQSGQVQMLPQPTGFIVPQQTAVLSAPNPFGVMQQAQQQPPSHLRLQPQPTGHRPFSSFLPPQVTGMPGSQQQQQQQTVFLQPQATGANPFRQSMLMPQTTGMAMFGVGSSNGMQPYSASFGSTNRALNGFPTFNGLSNPQSSTSLESTLSYPASTMTEPFSQGNAAALMNVPTRPASTPSTAFGPTQNSSSPPVAQPVKTHQTGTKNPFGPIITPVPPVPKPPTLMELAMGLVIRTSPVGSLNISHNNLMGLLKFRNLLALEVSR
ncbi:hypothetical protein D9757_012111 [Collybiopsis confluens]|uniref:ENTH domain-containing protein n=1 Tax=Collybiopsis confluens TaxID=2823264 RepID=A0A8H5D3G1_9AGAR|nr:hypothetical protein D9757_012111 [Collybiopsis confluens]